MRAYPALCGDAGDGALHAFDVLHLRRNQVHQRYHILGLCEDDEVVDPRNDVSLQTRCPMARRAVRTSLARPTWVSIRIYARVAIAMLFTLPLPPGEGWGGGEGRGYSGMAAVLVISTRLSGAPKLTMTVVRAGRSAGKNSA